MLDVNEHLKETSSLGVNVAKDPSTTRGFYILTKKSYNLSLTKSSKNDSA